MHLPTRTWGLAGLLFVAMLALSGCFQSGTDAGLEPTDPAFAPTNTMVFPTETPTIAEATPLAGLGVTTTPLAGEGEAIPQGELPTQAVIVTDPVTGLADGQGGPSFSPTPAGAVSLGSLEMTATAIMMGSQGQVAQSTSTATSFAQPAFQPTESVPLQEGEMTATAMIAGATANAGATQTAVATALGTYVPSATPEPDATLDPAIATANALLSTPQAQSEDCVHVVRRGENAFRIALRYGVTLDDIATANGLTNLTVLSVGQELIIPGCGNLAPTPGPASSQASSTTSLSSGQTHLIEPGENLYRIALRYGVTLRALANVNGISNVNLIRAGDTLIIP